MRKYFFFIFCICFIGFIGCVSIDEIPKNLYENYDVNSLKSTDITYQLATTNDVSVIVYDKEELIRFNQDWYLVHKDWIKTFNENQDTILDMMDQKKSQRIENWENKKKIIKNVVWYSIIGIILLIIGVKLYNKYKNGQ